VGLAGKELSLISSHKLIRILVAVALLVVLILVGVGVLWIGNLSFAGQPSLFERASLPRTATVGDLVVEAPPGYGVRVEGAEGWVGRTRLTLDWRQYLAGLRLHAGGDPKRLVRWAEREAECATGSRECRVRTDTIGGAVVVCQETAGRSGGRPDGSYAATCRAVGGNAIAVYLCVDSSCEVLRKVALASLSGVGAGAGRQVEPR
jgi:hypothetical protein